MTPEQIAAREKWIAALRSGEYKQGTRYLEISDRFCCLGVACKVLDVPGNADNGYGTAHLRSYCPVEVSVGMGLTHESISRLMSWNDSDGLTFAQIADKIEQGAV